jgi:hypothetical protein
MVLYMEKLADSIYERVATMSHEEIVRRFKKVFGREMTPDERDSFFLPNQQATPPSAKKCPPEITTLPGTLLAHLNPQSAPSGTRIFRLTN